MRGAPWLTSACRGCEPEALSQPGPDESLLMYATAFFVSSAACFSAHSVDPSRPHSSPSHDARTIVRFGFHPDLSSSPKPRAVSISATLPLVGSDAPFTHAS